MGRPLDLEVGVAFEPVGQEAQSDLEGDELARERQELLFFRRQETFGGFEVAFDQGLEHRELHPDLGEIRLIFGRRGGRSTHEVAEIVEHRARHHRIKVDDADAFLGDVVQEDVVQLGIVMRHAFGQGAVTQGVDDDADLVGASQGEGDLRHAGRGPSMGVLRQGLLEAGEA